VYLTGVGKARAVLSVKGGKSPIRVRPAGVIQFVYRYKSNEVNPATIIQVFKLESTKNSRKLEIAKAGTFSGSSSGDIAYLTFDAVKYGKSSYLITVKNLEAGEYGLALGETASHVVNLFGVD
jgi:hypothetical protein